MDHVFTSKTPRPWGVRNTFSAFQRGHHGTFTPVAKVPIPPGFQMPVYEKISVLQGTTKIEEDEDGNRAKVRSRDIEIRTQHQAVCSDRLVNPETFESILKTTSGWAVFGSNGQRLTEKGYSDPVKAFAGASSVQRGKTFVKESRR